jgi:hypothetical protein
MSNPPKQRGTAAESAVVKLAQSFGLTAERRALRGAADEGDVWIDGGRIVVEVKSRRKAWTWTEIDKWYREAEREAEHSHNCDAAVLVVKRPGSGYANAGDWYAWITVGDFNFIAAPRGFHVTATYCPDQRVMMPLSDLLAAYVGGKG